MDDPIPHISTARDPIRSEYDLQQRWRALMGPLGFTESLLWFCIIGPDRCMTPHLTQIEDLPARPDEVLAGNLLGVLGPLLEDAVPGGSVAFLLSRPGRLPTNGDRAWARALLLAALAARVPIEPIHLATDGLLVPLPVDDLDLPRSA